MDLEFFFVMQTNKHHLHCRHRHRFQSQSQSQSQSTASMDSYIQGWLFVIAAWFFSGSFAVPIKTPSVIKASADPVVFQTFKSSCVLVTGFFDGLVMAW